MKKDRALLVAGLIFLLVAVLHLLRYFAGLDIMVGTYVVSLNVSLVGFVVALALGLWMLMARRG